MKADLHVHTTFSDGTCTPAQVMQMARDRGVDVLAITDHDTLEGADEAARQTTSVRLIAGVELSLSDMRGLHLLGYGVGAQAEELRTTLAELAEARVERAREMLRLLDKLGYPLENTLLIQQGTVGRAHIARAMVNKGWVCSVQEAFDRFLAEGAPAYVPGKRLQMMQALPLLNRCRVVPVLAHPALLPVEETQLPALLQKWQDAGLQGVEVYHPAQRRYGFAGLERTARRMGLLVTGGSDFHTTAPDSHGTIGAMCLQWPAMQADTEALLARLHGSLQKE